MHPSNRYEWREPFRPFDRSVVDRHRLEIGAQLDLEVEIEGAGLQFVHHGRIENVRPNAQVEFTMDHARGVFRGRREADLRDVVTVTYRGHAPEVAQQRVAYRRLRQFDEREELVPCPVGPLELAPTSDKIREQLAEARLAARQVLRRADADLGENEIVLCRVGDENGIVFEHEIEGGRVRLALDQLRPGNIEHLHGTS